MHLTNILNLIRKKQDEDKRIIILFAAFVLSFLFVSGYLGWIYWKYNAHLQYGNPNDWLMQTSEVNNFSFRYPTEMDVIVPQDQIKYPISVVKKGERGESVLIQLGTWDTEPFQDLEAAVKRYQSATGNKRQSEKIEELVIDGRGGVLFIQNENTGRRILEALIWDPVPTTQDENAVPVTVSGRFGLPGSAREISLQLPGNATANDRILYEKLYREMLNSVKFIKR